jgi:hypothetical protein
MEDVEERMMCVYDYREERVVEGSWRIRLKARIMNEGLSELKGYMYMHYSSFQ